MSQPRLNVQPHFEGNVPAAFPLALLLSVRARDHPGEVLEDEDLSVSLPRRLGLTVVFETQIMRYENAQRGREPVRLEEVMSLMRLVLRRADAEPILREAGRRIAGWSFSTVPRWYTSLLRRAPNRLGTRSARRSAAQSLRKLRLGSRIDVAKPFSVRVIDPATAVVDPENPACALITGLLTEQLRLFTGRERGVLHSTCVTRGDAECVWVESG